MAEKSAEEIQQKIQELIKDRSFEALRPFLTSVEPRVGLWQAAPQAPQALSPTVADGVINALQWVQSQIKDGNDPHTTAKKVAEGFVQPEWVVSGNVTNVAGDGRVANRDYIEKAIINVFQTNLENVKSDIQRVSVVLLVMDRVQAQACQSGAAFENNPEAKSDFDALQSMLDIQFNAQWVQRYGINPQDWKPFINSEQTIAEVLAASLEELQDLRKYPKSIVPEFANVRDFYPTDSDRKNRLQRNRLKELRDMGCIVIMDIVSMRHPDIQVSYRRSWLDAFPNTLVARIAPNAQISQSRLKTKFTLDEELDFDFHHRVKYHPGESKCVNVVAKTDFENLILGQVPTLLSLQPENDNRHYQPGGRHS